MDNNDKSWMCIPIYLYICVYIAFYPMCAWYPGSSKKSMDSMWSWKKLRLYWACKMARVWQFKINLECDTNLVSLKLKRMEEWRWLIHVEPCSAVSFFLGVQQINESDKPWSFPYQLKVEVAIAFRWMIVHDGVIKRSEHTCGCFLQGRFKRVVDVL